MTLTPERSLDSLALTPLQQDIAILVMNGQTNREIADRLGLTPGLVGVQIGRILQRLGLPSRAELAAMRQGQFVRTAPQQPPEAPGAAAASEPATGMPRCPGGAPRGRGDAPSST